MRIVAVLKPVSTRCNLRCVYCYHWGQKTHLATRGKTMTLGLAKSLIEQVLELNDGRAEFIWHGGEPLLAGPTFYEEVLKAQKQFGGDKPLANSLQTNGTLVNEYWASFFHRAGWKVGVSLDGPAEIHNTNRVTVSGEGSFDLTIRGIELLKEAGVGVGISAVVTRVSLGREAEIFELLLSLTNSFDFSPYIIGPDPDEAAQKIAISDSEFAEFECRMFDIWWAKDNPKIRIRSLSNVVKAALGQTPTVCALGGSCTNFIGVDSNGDVYPCGRFLGQKPLLLGNLNKQSLVEILKSDTYGWFAQHVNNLSVECRECKWFYACHGGCMYERYAGGRMFVDKTPLCETHKIIYEHVSNKVAVTKEALQIDGSLSREDTS